MGGNYYEGDPTLLGTAAQVALGLTGLDFAADIRDLTHDLTNWEWTPQHIGGTLLDALSLLPGVGAAKYGDEALALAKKGLGMSDADAIIAAVGSLLKSGDEAKLLSRNGEELIETGSNTLKRADDALDESKGFIESAEKITKEQLANKPMNSPRPNRWYDNGGKVSINNDKTWTYHDWDGNSVSYIDGYPDFKSAGMVEQEVKIGKFEDYYKDFRNADNLAPNGSRKPGNTWHHNQDGITMQEMRRSLHERYTHEGGMSLSRKMR